MNTARGPREVAGAALSAEPIVTFVDLDAARPLLFATEDALPRLSPEDRARAERKGGDVETLMRWRAARIATRIVLERYAGPTIRSVDFILADGGRPELPAGMPVFNVSHSGGVALIAVAQSGAVGIDIEGARTLSMSLERRQRLVTAAAAIDAACDALDPASDDDVLRAWVRLEAVAKALGSGIGRMLTAHGVIAQSTGVRGMDDRVASLRVGDLSVPEGYVAAIAATALPEHVDVQRFPATADALSQYLADV